MDQSKNKHEVGNLKIYDAKFFSIEAPVLPSILSELLKSYTNR